MSRIGGPFPFPISDVQYGGGFVTLGSGGVFYPAAGNYVWSSGALTALQTFDPIQGQWRTLADPSANSDNFDCDGSNWRFINLSGTVAALSITNAGSGATNGIGTAATGVTIAIGSPTPPGGTATAYPIVGGAVVAPTVNTAGSGFLVPPMILIDPPPYGGVQATAICTLTAVGGGIASITMVNPGAGYNTAGAPPNFYILPQPGSYQGSIVGGTTAAGASPPPGIVNPASSVPGVVPVYFGPGTAATAGALLNAATLTGSGTLTGVGMILNGSLYTGTTIPTVTITGCGPAAATAVMNFTLTGITGLVAGSGYTGSAPIFKTSEGVVLTSGQFNNYDLGGAPATGVATVSGGAVTGVIIEDSGFGFQKVPELTFINAGAVPSVLATATPVVGGATDTFTLQAKVN